ncbi:unnamed protein product [Trichobilharzia regenti]|nr:unnamed protein product [Trichobilharzia regenti]
MKIDSNSLSTSEFNKMAWNENGFENKLNDSKAGNNCAFLLDCHSTQNDKVSAYEGDGCKPKINFTAVNCMTPSAVALSKKAIKSTFILKDTRSHHLGRKSVVKQNGTVEISRNTSPKKKQSTQEVELIGDSVNTMNNKCNDKNKDISLKLNTFHVLDDNQVKNLIHVNGVEVVDKLSIENVNNTPKQVPVQLNKTSVKQINPKKDSTSYRSDNNTSINIDRKIKIDDNKHIKKDATLRPNSLVLPNPSKAVDFLLPNKCIQPSESKAESVDHGMKLKNKKVSLHLTTLVFIILLYVFSYVFVWVEK